MNRSLARALLALTILMATSITPAAAAPSVSNAWARATPPGATVAAVYLRIDGGTDADHLVGAHSIRATRIEFHSSAETGGVVRMRAAEAIEVPAEQVTELAPQGRHLMLFGLTAPLRAGEQLPLKLVFARGGEQDVNVQVRDATAGADLPLHH